MRHTRHALLILAASLACLACSSDTTDKASTVQITIDTLITAENAAWGPFRSAAFLDDSTLVISDVQVAQLVVAPLGSGEPRTIGRRGGAPGELQLPGALHVSDDTISVIDLMQARRSRFRADGTFLDNLPVTPMLGSRGARFANSTTVITSTLGDKKALAELMRLDGTSIATYGEALAPLANGFPFPQMKQEALKGRIPEQLKNSVTTAPGVSDDLWLVTHVAGRIQRWSNDGTLLGTYQLSPDDLSAAQSTFFGDPELKKLDSPRMPSPSVVSSLLPDTTGAWVLLRRPQGSPGLLIRLDANARELRRVELPNIETLGLLLRSPNGQRVVGLVPNEGIVLDVRGLDS